MVCNNKENYLFLYLNTGSGHRTPASILKKELEQTYGDNVFLLNGFSPKQHIAHAFFEMGYHSSSATFPAIYSLVYDLSSLKPVMKLLSFFTSLYTKYHIADLIKKYNITKILSFHFALTPSAAAVIKLLNRKIPLITDITDPYSAHPSWYLEKSSTFIVHSQELENHILKNHLLNKDQIVIKPFIFDKKFNADYTESDISELKEKHHIPQDDKVILIAGGGEGLPGVINLVTQFSLSKDITEAISIIVVCGHNASSRTILEGLSIINPRIKLNILGYVNCMDELIKLSDCVITKAGVLGIVRSIFYCVGPDRIRGTWVQYTVMMFAVVTMVYGAVKAVKEQDCKRRLAYSTVSNLSYIIFAASLMRSSGMQAAMLHMLFHGLMKITLFYCIGAVMVKTGKRYVWEMDGMGRRMPLVFAVYTVAGLSLIGIPPMVGFISKWYIGTAAAAEGTVFSYIGLAALILSALLSAAYILEVVVRAWMPGKDSRPDDSAAVAVGFRMRIPLLILVLLVLVCGVCSTPIVTFLSEVAGGLR